MIVPTVKFMLYSSLAYKNVCGDDYLLGEKRQAYYTGKTMIRTRETSPRWMQ
jgi:hypothetical protein